MQEPDRAAPTPDTPPDAPLALFARTGSALRLVALDAHAARAGLAAGMTLADARARLPALVAVEQDDAADRHWLDRLAHDCLRYAPQVMPLPPDAIVIDISGAAHLWGGETALVDAVEDWSAAQGLTLRRACGATSDGALALARHGRWPVADEGAALRALPVAALELEAEAMRLMQRAGLKTVGAVAARPMAAIAARYGLAAVTAVERLLGAERAPITALQPPQPLRFIRRFADPVAHQSAIAAAMHELLMLAARALEERGEGGRRFALTLHRSDGARHRLTIGTGAPTRDPALVLRLFDERIATLADPLDPGFGYDSMVLRVGQTQPLAATQSGLADDGAARDAAALAELIDRLGTRFGPDRLCRLVPRDSHIPEQAQLALPAVAAPEPVRWPAPPPGEPPQRPLFLFDPPERILVIAAVPDGPPHRFRWRRKLHEVRLYEGPERIAVEWWRRAGGEHQGRGGLTRDYYRVEDARGRRFWMFRHGLYDEKPDPDWYLHGLFA